MNQLVKDNQCSRSLFRVTVPVSKIELYKLVSKRAHLKGSHPSFNNARQFTHIHFLPHSLLFVNNKNELLNIKHTRQ